MKICHLTTSFPRFEGDPSSHFVYEQVRHLSGHEITVLAPMDEKTKKNEALGGARVERFSYFFKPFQNVAYGSGLANNLRHWSARAVFPFFMLFFFLKAWSVSRGKDMLHAHWVVAGFVAMLIKKLTGKPYVLTVYRSVWENPISQRLNRAVLENANYVIFISSYVRDQSLQIADVKNQVIPLGVDEKRFRPNVKGKMRKELGLKGNMVLSVGRLVEKKGFVYLLEAVEDLDCSLVIIGRGEDREMLERKAKDLNIEERIVFVNSVPNEIMPNYMKDADLFVLPSIVDSKGETETQGVVLVEAQACGVPVVGSKVGGIIDVIKDGKTGYLVEEKDVEEMRAKIGKLLEDKKLRKKMGKAGRRKVLKEFTWNSSAQKIKKAYSKAVE